MFLWVLLLILNVVCCWTFPDILAKSIDLNRCFKRYDKKGQKTVVTITALYFLQVGGSFCLDIVKSKYNTHWNMCKQIFWMWIIQFQTLIWFSVFGRIGYNRVMEKLSSVPLIICKISKWIWTDSIDRLTKVQYYGEYSRFSGSIIIVIYITSRGYLQLLNFHATLTYNNGKVKIDWKLTANSYGPHYTIYVVSSETENPWKHLIDEL